VTTARQHDKDWSGYVVDVEIGYREDPDRVIALMRRVFRGAAADPAHGPLIIEPIEIFGWTRSRTRACDQGSPQDTTIQQWTVGRGTAASPPVLRCEGIEVPAARVVQVGDSGKPFPLLVMQGAPPVPREAHP